jgi:hypothetical protein
VSIDVNRIINGTPEKRLFNGYSLMKENYTEANAQNFYNQYTTEKLSDLLDNIKYYAFETYVGQDFYESVISDTNSCVFSKLLDNKRDIENYYESYSSKMNDTQRANTEHLVNSINEAVNNNKEMIIVDRTLRDVELNESTNEIMNAIHAKDSEKIISIFNECAENDNVPNYFVMLYAPFVESAFNDEFGTLNEINKSIIKKCGNTEVNYESYVRDVVVMTKLANNKIFTEKVNTLPNFDVRNIIKSYMTENLLDKVENMNKESFEDSHDYFHTTMEMAMTNLFYDMYESERLLEENSNAKLENIKCQALPYDYTAYLFAYEGACFANGEGEASNDKYVLEGYPVLNGNKTFNEASNYIVDKIRNINPNYYNFFEDADGDLDELEKEEYGDEKEEDKKKKDTTDSSNKKEISDRESDYTSSAGKTPKPPKSGTWTNRVQVAAQDFRVKHDKKAVERQKAFGDLKNAAKAVTDIPKNTIEGIKKGIHKMDIKDENRRKAEMLEPGYRKKIFKNIRLAILYGGTARYNLGMIPFVMLGRHLSKQKNARIRNELMSELNTEIEVCNEKIDQARSDNDRQELYRLIRIRNRLKDELVRVKTNSKYI